MSIWLQESASIQPRTSPLNFGNFICKHLQTSNICQILRYLFFFQFSIQSHFSDLRQLSGIPLNAEKNLQHYAEFELGVLQKCANQILKDMLRDEHLLARIGFDTAENETSSL